MRIACPVCQSKFTIAELMHEAAKDEMIEMASRFGRNWGLVFDYTECFRADQWASVREQKRLRLLQEVWKLFEKNEFEYDGKRFRTTGWAEIIKGLRTVVDAEKYGFKNHNYLKKILLSQAKRLSDEGLTAAEEREREKKRRTSNTEHRTSKEERKGLTAEEFKRLEGIESLVDKIGSQFDGENG